MTKRLTRPHKKTGRPLVPIDSKVVEGMAKVGATNIEIAAFCQASLQTIDRRFGTLITKSRAGQKLRLRQLQYRKAQAGSDTMLIWLGKNVLHQSDKQEITGAEGAPLLPKEIIWRMVRPPTSE